MRKRSLLIVSLAFIGLVVLLLSLPGPAATQDLPAGPRPTPTAATLPQNYVPSAPAAPDTMPDLVVESIRLSTPNPYVNRDVTVYVTIKNVGNADVEPGNNFFLDFYINPPTDDLRGLRGDRYWAVQGYLMGIGESAEFSTVIQFADMASFSLWAQVDTPEYPGWQLGHIIESNEDNNILGPQNVGVRTHSAWVQKDHTDFFRNMASTLDVVPVAGTVGIITNTPGLVIDGDSALALGIFDEPPWTTWGLPALTTQDQKNDYNMILPDKQLNFGTNYDQDNVSIHAEANWVVAVWEDSRNGPVYGKDIFLRWSIDQGQTWQPAGADVQVNETVGGHAANDQKHPSVAVAPDGRIVVAWQDHRGSSFDIYVQVFSLAGGSLVTCQANGDCATACNPATTACNFRVDTDANARDQILPDVAVDGTGNFYIAWQDQRNMNDDIFAVRSYTSAGACVKDRKSLGFAPTSATVEASASAPDLANLCWGDDTMIGDYPTMTTQASPSITAINGVRVTDITCEIDYETLQLYNCVVSTEPTSYIAVTWEDWREGDADIYMTYSEDEGETFVLDRRLNDDKAPSSTNGIGQYQPAVAVNQWMKKVSLVKPIPPYGNATGIIEVPVTTMHIVWQDMRHSTDAALENDPDIYYNTITVEPDPMWPWPVVFTDEGQQQVNDNDERSWQTGPVWQGEPDVAAKSSALTLAESDAYNAFVTWADGRNYGAGEFQNLDIYFRLFSSEGEPTEFTGGNNLMVNDNVRLHNFTTASYPDYRHDMPPHGRQRGPSIAATLIADWPTIYGGYVFVAWDDDRPTNPFVDRNVFMARTNMLFGGHYTTFTAPPGAPGGGEYYGSGAFVSEIFDTLSTETTWYAVDWHGATDSGTYITLQTRIGNTRDAVLASDWYPKRFPYPDDALGKGSPLQGYDAPGQHIENSIGGYWPKARYIQYRVNFWARNASPDPGGIVLYTPFLYDVILHYEKPMTHIYLPLAKRKK